MMNRTATLLVALVVVVASAVVAPVAAAQTDTPTPTPVQTDEGTATNVTGINTETATNTTGTDADTANESGNDSVAAGALLSGAIGVQEAEIDGEVESRSFGIEIAQAATDDAKARVVGEQLNDSEGRLMELQDRLDSLADARENGSISQGQYASRAAKLQTEVNNIQRMGNETATVSETLPRETLEANGVNATAIQTLRQNAATMAGPEVAAVARTIAGPGAGQGPPERAGGAGDRPGGNETGPSDRPGGNETGPSDRPGGNETGPGDQPSGNETGPSDRPGGNETDTTSDGNERSGSGSDADSSGDDADNAQRNGDSGGGDNAQRNGDNDGGGADNAQRNGEQGR